MTAARGGRRRIGLALAAAVLGACDGSTAVETPPAAGAGALELEVLRGNDQTGVVGGTLEQPLVLRVRTRDGIAVNGVELGVEQAAGMFTANQSWRTGPDGTAAFYWQLGEHAGPQSAVFVVTSAPQHSAVGPAIVRALASPDRPVAVRAAAKVAFVGGTPAVVGVLVTDRYGNRVGGAPIRWTAAGGVFEDSVTRSAAYGEATVHWTPPGEPSVSVLEARLVDTVGAALASATLYRVKEAPLDGSSPVGRWHAVSWAFFRDSLHQDRVTDLVVDPPHLWGTLIVVRTGAGGYQWFWQDWWGDYGSDYSTGDALPGPDASLVVLVRTRESDLECDWGPCVVPFQGPQRLRLEGDQLTFESTESAVFWNGYASPGSFPAWATLVLRRP